MAELAQQILAADIGGTSSRFGRFSYSSGILELAESTWLETTGAVTLRDLVKQLPGKGFTLTTAAADFVSIAVAGPVEGGSYGKLTQAELSIDLRQAAADYEISSFALINDFLAQAYACVSPIRAKAQPVLAGQPDSNGSIAVIGAGTGLGKAFLVSDLRGGFIAAPSEGGHSTFSPETDEEFQLAKFIQDLDKLPYVTWEDVISGRGLNRIRRFLTGEDLTPQQVAGQFKTGDATLALAARLYGRVVRNFALETLATGGVFIAGGVAAKNPILIQHHEFEASFRSSRRHERLLARIPVALNTDQECGLWGAAWLAAYRLGLS